MVVRDIDKDVKECLQRRVTQHGRRMEAEVRDIHLQQRVASFDQKVAEAAAILMAARRSAGKTGDLRTV